MDFAWFIKVKNNYFFIFDYFYLKSKSARIVVIDQNTSCIAKMVHVFYVILITDYNINI